MAKREVIDCDKCGKPTGDKSNSVSVCVGTYRDAAGSTDTDDRSFDLCRYCCQSELQRLLGRLSHLEAKRFCERITKQTFRDHRGIVEILPLD